MRYITRMEKYKKGCRTWSVRLQMAGVQKSFPDSKYGGREKALAAAKEWRDKMVLLYPDFGPGYKNRALKEYGNPRRNNSTGIDGVNMEYLSDRNSISFQARYYENGKVRRKCFTIGKKYDVDEAFYLAAKARYELTGRGDEFNDVVLDFERVRDKYEEMKKRHLGK